MIEAPDPREPRWVDIAVHDHDGEQCEPSPHPGDDMDNVCIHGFTLRMITVEW